MQFLFSNSVWSWGILWLHPLLILALLLLGLNRFGQRSQALEALAQTLVGFFDSLSTVIVEMTKWLAPAMALTVAALVISRYTFGLSAIKPQEAVVYMHALLFLFAAPAALLTNSHVRVDIFYEKLSAQGRAVIDIFGTIFLLMPVSILIFKYGGSYAARAWQFFESSAEADGLHGVFLLKTAIPVFAVLMMAQGATMALRAAVLLIGVPIAPPQSLEEAV